MIVFIIRKLIKLKQKLIIQNFSKPKYELMLIVEMPLLRRVIKNKIHNFNGFAEALMASYLYIYCDTSNIKLSSFIF